MDNLNSQAKVSQKLNIISGNCLQVQLMYIVVLIMHVASYYRDNANSYYRCCDSTYYHDN